MQKKTMTVDARKYELMEKALKAVYIRTAFIGWPSEKFWNAGTDEHPHMIPDWTEEIRLVDKALHM